MRRRRLPRRRRLLHRRLTSSSRGRSRRRLVSTGVQEDRDQNRKQRNKKFFHSVNHRYIIGSPQASSADLN